MELVDSAECIRYYQEKLKYFHNKLGFSHLGQYELEINHFIEYIYDTADRELVFQGYNVNTRKVVTTSCEYAHRWSQTYVNRVLHRLYKLDDIKINNATMVTMTTYHDSDYAFAKTGKRFSMVDSFEELLKSRAKLIQILRNMYDDVQYFWVLEPHESGYPHCHMLVFKDISKSEKLKLKHLWSDKYETGSFQHGLAFTDVENIRRTRNYLMKYMKKSVSAIGLRDGRFDIRQLCYHAVAKEHGYRFFGCSSAVSQLMNFELKRPYNDEIIWYRCSVDIMKEHSYAPDNYYKERHECSISQKNYELALEKLERTKQEYVFLGDCPF